MSAGRKDPRPSRILPGSIRGRVHRPRARRSSLIGPWFAQCIAVADVPAGHLIRGPDVAPCEPPGSSPRQPATRTDDWFAECTGDPLTSDDDCASPGRHGRSQSLSSGTDQPRLRNARHHARPEASSRLEDLRQPGAGRRRHRTLQSACCYRLAANRSQCSRGLWTGDKVVADIDGGRQ
jgi:hypothetical protein